MKLPKLFIRTPKGRYMPYVLPDNDISSTLFRRINGKYVPVSMLTPFQELQEGIWVVTARPSCKSITNGTYLREVMNLDKLCDIERFPIKDIADMKACVDWVMDHISFHRDSHFIADMVYDVVARVYEYNKMLKEGKLDEIKGSGIE